MQVCAAVLILKCLSVKGVQELITVSKCQHDSKVFSGLVFVCLSESAVSYLSAKFRCLIPAKPFIP